MSMKALRTLVTIVTCWAGASSCASEDSSSYCLGCGDPGVTIYVPESPEGEAVPVELSERTERAGAAASRYGIRAYRPRVDGSLAYVEFIDRNDVAIGGVYASVSRGSDLVLDVVYRDDASTVLVRLNQWEDSRVRGAFNEGDFDFVFDADEVTMMIEPDHAATYAFDVLYDTYDEVAALDFELARDPNDLWWDPCDEVRLDAALAVAGYLVEYDPNADDRAEAMRAGLSAHLSCE